MACTSEILGSGKETGRRIEWIFWGMAVTMKLPKAGGHCISPRALGHTALSYIQAPVAGSRFDRKGRYIDGTGRYIVV